MYFSVETDQGRGIEKVEIEVSDKCPLTFGQLDLSNEIDKTPVYDMTFEELEEKTNNISNYKIDCLYICEPWNSSSIYYILPGYIENGFTGVAFIRSLEDKETVSLGNILKEKLIKIFSEEYVIKMQFNMPEALANDIISQAIKPYKIGHVVLMKDSPYSENLIEEKLGIGFGIDELDNPAQEDELSSTDKYDSEMVEHTLEVIDAIKTDLKGYEEGCLNHTEFVYTDIAGFSKEESKELSREFCERRIEEYQKCIAKGGKEAFDCIYEKEMNRGDL